MKGQAVPPRVAAGAAAVSAAAARRKGQRVVAPAGAAIDRPLQFLEPPCRLCGRHRKAHRLPRVGGGDGGGGPWSAAAEADGAASASDRGPCQLTTATNTATATTDAAATTTDAARHALHVQSAYWLTRRRGAHTERAAPLECDELAEHCTLRE